MPRKRPNATPKPAQKRGRPAKPNLGGRPTKAVVEARRKAEAEGKIIGTPIAPSTSTGSAAYQGAMRKISREEAFWGVGPRRPITSTGAIRERASKGRSNPEPETLAVERALGELGTAKTSENTTGIVTSPAKDEPSPSLVGPGVPRIIRSQRVDPFQARQEDADVWERLVNLHDSIRHMMEDAVVYKPSRVIRETPSGYADLVRQGRVGPATLQTYIDESQIKPAPEAETTPAPKKTKKVKTEAEINEEKAAKEAALADMREADLAEKKKKKKK